MNLSINTNINIFKDNLINLIGNSNLPIGVVYYIIQNISLELENVYNETLVKEQQEILETSLKENEDKDENNEETNEEIENK